MNKKQLESYTENAKEMNRLKRLKQQYENEIRPSSRSLIDLTKQSLNVKEFTFNHVLAEKILIIDDRLKQLQYQNNQVISFINSLPNQEQQLLTDLYIKEMPRQKCAHKYYCEVLTLTRTVNRILVDYYPYEVVL